MAHYRVTLADALAAHEEALSYGGRAGIISLHLIESAIARPYSGYHRSMATKCAALLHAMVNNHGFLDCDKRTAWLVVELLIERSGYRLAIPDDARVDDLVVDVASDRLSFNEIVEWFDLRLARA
ncbi:MAG: type II toxin-antitoxin system death-on-curing family toxin [Rhodobacter sp.]|nr:type II toxin-antitoxin system death-on-curing family toxin [Rhodobacter sp.]